MKFWIVWEPDLIGTNQYDSYTKAAEELEELKADYPEGKFIIMESTNDPVTNK